VYVSEENATTAEAAEWVALAVTVAVVPVLPVVVLPVVLVPVVLLPVVLLPVVLPPVVLLPVELLLVVLLPVVPLPVVPLPVELLLVVLLPAPVTAAAVAVPELETLVDDPLHAARNPSSAKQGRRIRAGVSVIAELAGVVSAARFSSAK